MDILYCVYSNKKFIIPNEVAKEFTNKHTLIALQELVVKSHQGYFTSHLTSLSYFRRYGKGEREGLALALQVDNWIICDDLLVREGAKLLQVNISGTVGTKL